MVPKPITQVNKKGGIDGLDAAAVLACKYTGPQVADEIRSESDLSYKVHLTTTYECAGDTAKLR